MKKELALGLGAVLVAGIGFVSFKLKDRKSEKNKI